MNQNSIKKLLDAFFVAKKIIETMPELPNKMKPRHIHVIDALYELSKTQNEVRVSDISTRLSITTPSVTKLINELVSKDIVEKYESELDKRITLIKLTEKGLKYEAKYVTEYHADWLKNIEDLTDDEVLSTINTINKLKKSMPKGVENNE